MLDSVQYRHKHPQYLLRIPALVLAQPPAILPPCIAQNNPRQIPYGRSYGRQAIPARPEPIITGPVPKHQHQAHDDGQGWDDGGGQAETTDDMRVKVDDQDGEERVQEHRD